MNVRTAAVLLGAVATVAVVQATIVPASFNFLAPVPYDTGEAGPAEVEVGDYDADGLLDLAVRTTGNGSEIQLLYGDGAGALLKDPTLPTPLGAGFGSGDFNGDGRLDIAVGQQGSSPAGSFGPCGSTPGTMILLGTAGVPPLAFAQCVPGHLGVTLTDVVAADFTGDGRLDLAVADEGLWGMRTYRGRGDGTFVTTAVAATGAAGVRVYGPLVVADVDGNGTHDVIARTGAAVGSAGGVATFLGDGAGGLRFSSTAVGGALAQHAGVLAAAVADVNGDGIVDIAGVERGRAALGDPLGNWLFVALGAGDGRLYTTTWTKSLPDGAVGDVVPADLNPDGTTDIAVVHTGGDAVRLYAGYGDGSFAATAAVIALGAAPKFAAAADWNRDRAPDLAVVDLGGGGSSRTWAVLQAPTSAGAPDLVVTRLAAPKYVAAGQAYRVTDNTANRGPGAASSSATRLFLSHDARLDPADAILGTRAVAVLAAGTSDLGSSSVVVPAGTAVGKYYLIAAADAAAAVAESDESNNSRARRVCVGPDFVVKSVTAPLAAPAGTSISVTDATRNLGAVPVPESLTRISLSSDRKLDAGDVALGTRSVPALGVGATSTATTSLTLPALTTPGTYYLIARADSAGVVPEALETNNTRATAITIR